MNPLTQIQNTRKRSLAEIELGLSDRASWHDRYRHSAYVFVGNIAEKLTEGDVLTVFSQYGEVVDLAMPRDRDTKQHRGFAFLAYRDQRSTVLAVDNLAGSVVAGRTLRVEHVDRYERRIELEDGRGEGDASGANAAPIGTREGEGRRGSVEGPDERGQPGAAGRREPPSASASASGRPSAPASSGRAPWELEEAGPPAGDGSPLGAPTTLAELRARAAAKRGEGDRRGDREEAGGGERRERDRGERRGEERKRSERRDRDRGEERSERRERDRGEERSERRERDRGEERNERRERDRGEERSERRGRGREEGRDRDWGDSRRSHDDSHRSHDSSHRSHDDSRRSHDGSRRSHDDSRRSHDDSRRRDRSPREGKDARRGDDRPRSSRE